MAIKTFTAGSVLTASDTNTYLANSGLVFVNQTTFTNASSASPVNVDNVFTNTMTHYRLMIQLTNTTANNSILLRMRNAGTTNANSEYAWGGFISYMGSAILNATTSGGTAAHWVITEMDTANYPNMPAQVEIMNPKASFRTTIFSNGFTPVSPHPYYRHLGGTMTVTTSYDGFALIPSAGNISGTVTCYGYRIS